MDKAAGVLAEKIGDYCHTKYMGCSKARNTGDTNHDFDYSYTDEVVNMVAEYFKTDEGQQALQELKRAEGTPNP